MPEEYLIDHCSPTLAGLKTGSIFTVDVDEERELESTISEINTELQEKGIKALLIRKKGSRALVYLYRPDYLDRDLRNPEAAAILSERGYLSDDAERCISQLMANLSKSDSFPHEIGLFLGYPPEDVKGFIHSPNKGVKCVGYWKVYGNKDEAEKTFAKYQKCRMEYQRQYKKGKSLTQLAVKSRGVDINC